ncbi:ClpP/crotonase-like domain-containing protein [Xylariales sp. PMI_506]|nr:ClpP/crotonase-like domain-containing protein [Xylariales sp. PMI_506]
MPPTPKERFTVPIQALGQHPGGSVVCSEPSPQVYLLTFCSPPDNRLTHNFINALLAALDIVEAHYPPGVVVTTSAISKFFSNGLDLGIAGSMPLFFENYLYKLLRRFLTYPMPTIALVNGHAFAGGFMLAMHHDYRVFSGTKGYLCVNEIEFGAPIPQPLVNIYLVKTSPNVYRDVVTEGRRWTPKAALAAGLIDSEDGWEGVEKLIQDRALLKKGTTGVYGVLKSELYRQQVQLLDAPGDSVAAVRQWMEREEGRKDQVKTNAAKWKL